MKKWAYYNEHDAYAAQWIRNLIKAGNIAPGEVDERSIEDVYPIELREFRQCHFFAGVAVWSHSLRLAGWADDRPVWTGSCPCQPFSAAGAGAGFADERHLWPAFHHLIRERRPECVFGEQVASSDSGPWIDLVHDDMEAVGYAFGAVPFPSASVGAPHIRDRLYWVANTNELAGRQGSEDRGGRAAGSDAQPRAGSGGGGLPGGLADTSGAGLGIVGRGGLTGEKDTWPHSDLDHEIHAAGPTNGHWGDADWLHCRDGKWRPVEPGSAPLVASAARGLGRVRAGWDAPAGKEGQGSRVGRLRGYGNAINAEAARVFIESFLDGELA